MKKLLTLLSLLIFTAGCTVVGPGDRGVRLYSGEAQKELLKPGMHGYFPVLLTVSHMSVRVQKDEFRTNSASKDMQDVITTIAINWSVDPTKVYDVYTTIGTLEAVETKILRPAVNEVLKSTTAKLTAEEILTRRIELKNDIDASLTARLVKYGLLISDISIVNLSFSEQFTHAIENKQIAEQLSKEAEYLAVKTVKEAEGRANAGITLEKALAKQAVIKARAGAEAEILTAKGLAKAKVLKANAEAQANMTVNKTLTSDLIQYEKVKSWNGKLPQFTGGNAGVLLSLPTSK